MIYMVNLLPIKFKKQSEPMYCYVSCLKMVIDYAIDELKVSQRRLTINAIAKCTRTHPLEGTIIMDIERINELLIDSVPQISFKDQVGGSLPDIIMELHGENPVPLIAWILGVEDDGDRIFHSIVINGVPEDRTQIFYVDPARTEDDYQCDEEIGEFLDNKLGVSGRLVKLKISKKGHKDLLGKVHPLTRGRN